MALGIEENCQWTLFSGLRPVERSDRGQLGIIEGGQSIGLADSYIKDFTRIRACNFREFWDDRNEECQVCPIIDNK